MIRSMTRRGIPKPFAVLVAALLALYFVPLGASPALAAGPANIDIYDQCFTGDPPVGGGECEGWTNGILNDSNSDYNEDEVTPQRLIVTFEEAGTHTIDISYLTFDHDVHAYDSLATWNHTLTNADRCQDIIAADCVADASPSTFPIPLDSTVHHDIGVGKSAIVSDHQLTGQVLTLYGGELTGATYLGMGTYAPDYQTLRVTLTTAAPDTKVMLLFGGHIAATFGPRGWGERADGSNLGAAQVPGGSYHIRITQINEEAIGNRDNQLMSGAIEPPTATDISTNATAENITGDPAVVIGGSISDTATVSPPDAVGTVTFTLFGPNNATCSGTPIFTSTKALTGTTAGVVTSDAFTPTAVGTYRWIASFTPTDPTKFTAVAGSCNDANESSVVIKKQPTISTDATDTASLPGASISDVATVSNLTSDASGTVTFKLWGPDNATCSGTEIFTSTKPLGTVTAGVATVTSDAFTVTAAGTYRWIASYSGDAKNFPVSGACNDANESSVVNKANPTISTTATNGTLPPGTISDTANLTGVTANAGGSITFRLFGPSASPSCSGSPVFTSTPVAVSGPGSYGPVTATVTAGGSYYWIASYSGDANNNAVAGACGDAGETSVVRVLQGALNISKAVSPVAGGGTVIEFGDTLTYTLTVSATGELTQNNVVVTDFIPGYDPARPTSGKTTYVAGSAACIGGGTCTITQPGADHKITWALGDMAPGTTRQVTFKVTIDDVAGDPGETVAVDILNAGAVRSTQTPPKASNEVRTPVTKVLPVKRSKPPAVLPHTGTTVQPGPLAAGAVLLLGLGLLLLAAGRRRGPAGSHHK
jgi:LPXTG-motif cell wall-anchored protein